VGVCGDVGVVLGECVNYCVLMYGGGWEADGEVDIYEVEGREEGDIGEERG
jgi:hypothetical protein